MPMYSIQLYALTIHSVYLLISLSLSLPHSYSVDPSLFPPQEVTKKPVESEPSLLSVLLAEYNKRSANPFFEFSKFNGEVNSQFIYIICLQWFAG